MVDTAQFRNHIFEAQPPVIDADGVHQEFVSDMHGQKTDFDNILTGSLLYVEWVDVNEDYIRNEYPEQPLILLGVANGTNRLALDVARRFDGEVLGLISEKNPKNSKELWLPVTAKKIIKVLKPKLVLVLEDTGTTGFNCVQIAAQAFDAGAEDLEVLITLQRRAQLERLEEKGIKYRAIITELLDTYLPDDCRNLPEGFCYRGWKLIPRSK